MVYRDVHLVIVPASSLYIHQVREDISIRTTAVFYKSTILIDHCN